MQITFLYTKNKKQGSFLKSFFVVLVKSTLSSPLHPKKILNLSCHQLREQLREKSKPIKSTQAKNHKGNQTCTLKPRGLGVSYNKNEALYLEVAVRFC